VLGSVEKGSEGLGSSSVDTDTDDNPTGQVFKAWQNVRGTLNSLDSEMLGSLIDDYTAGWVLAGIEEANKSSKGPPSLKYLDAILQRWKREGFKSQFGPKQSEGMDIEWLNETSSAN